MCALPGWRKAAGLPLDAVAGLAGLCGMYDLEPIRLSSRNATLELDAGTARAMSPAAGDGARQAPPPAVAAYGARESEEMARQARALASGWAAAGGEVAVIAAKGRNHFDLLDDLAIPESALAQAVRGLVTRAATGSGAAP
jgi:arylformamidase